MLPLTIKEALAQYRATAGPKFAAIIEGYWRRHGAPDDSNLRAEIKRMQAAGYAKSTIDLHVRTVRAFCRRYERYGLAVPQKPKLDFDRRRDRDVADLAPETIRTMIDAAKRGLPQESAAMALASTYGLRAGELTRIVPDDLDRRGDRFFVRSEKKSLQRWCWLPPEVATWVPDPWQPITDSYAIFARLWPHGEKPKRLGWHSLRRSLVRDLKAAGVPQESRTRFLRWAGTTGAEAMDDLYANATSTVGAEGKRPARLEDEGRREYDEEVWMRHPWLRLWL